MVKKIGPKGPTAVSGANPIESGPQKTEKAAGVAKVGTISGVGSVGSTSRTGSTERVGRKLNFQDREQIMAIVEEESDKLFADGNIPTAKKKVLEKAVKMALDAGMIDESQTSSQKK